MHKEHQKGNRTATLTVIIPTYNYAQYLLTAIDSALSLPIRTEIIIIDDGSTDETPSIVRPLLAQNENITYIQQENAGPGVARNKGIERANSEVIVFLDADDELITEGVLTAVTMMSNNPDIEVMVTSHISQQENQIKTHTPGKASTNKEENFKNYLIDKKLTMSNGSVFIRTGSISEYRFPNLRNSEDIPFFALLLANLNVSSIDAKTAIIHKHSESLRHNTEYANSISDTLVAQVFDNPNIPLWAQRYKKQYHANRCLSLFRTFYKAEIYNNSLKYYIEAFRLNPGSALKPNNIKKVIIAFLRK